jgi:hypothetical protein
MISIKKMVTAVSRSQGRRIFHKEATNCRGWPYHVKVTWIISNHMMDCLHYYFYFDFKWFFFFISLNAGNEIGLAQLELEMTVVFSLLL